MHYPCKDRNISRFCIIGDDVISIARTFLRMEEDYAKLRLPQHAMNELCMLLYHEAYAPVSTVIAIFISLGLAYYGKINMVFMFVLCVFFPEAS